MASRPRKINRSALSRGPAKLSRLGSLRLDSEKAMAKLARSDRGSADYAEAMAQVEKNALDEFELRLMQLNKMFEAEPA